jgi:hypothetical protein
LNGVGPGSAARLAAVLDTKPGGREETSGTLLALLVFGYVKGRLTGAAPVRAALHTVLVGSIAAAAAFALARAMA